MTLAEHDHMINALASDGADQSFGTAVLPWRSRRCRSVANAHRANAARKCLAVDPIPITDEVLGRALPTACLGDLPGDPFGSRMRSAPSHRIRRRSCRRTSNPYKSRNEIVGTTNRSVEAI